MTCMKRTSIVGSVHINTVIFDSTIQVGDNRYIDANAYIFALQRERAEFRVNEEPLEKHPIFRRAIPQLSLREDLRMYRKNTVPAITVGTVNVKSVSTSSVLQVGSNTCIDLTSRIKHVRQFLPTAAQTSAPGASIAPPSARA